MNIEEIIEKIKNEYFEIKWTDLSSNGNFFSEGNIEIPQEYRSKELISTKEKKVLIINHLILEGFLLITELKKFEEEDLIIIAKNYSEIIERNYNQEECTFFKVNELNYSTYFISTNISVDEILRNINTITRFKKLEDFKKSISLWLDNWDDYGYKTKLRVKIWNSIFSLRVNPHSDLMIKYIKENQKKPDDKDLCSLGDENYYEFLKKYLSYDDRKSWFELTNDLAFNLNELDRINNFYKNHINTSHGFEEIIVPIAWNKNFFHSSFLRSQSIKEIKEVLHPIAVSDGKKKAIKKALDDNISEIKYLFNDSNGEKGTLTFRKIKSSFLPMRVYGIVGGNGSGKSYKINQIIRNHLEEDNNFSQIIHFSLSPVDDKIIYNKNVILKDEEKDKEGDVIYEKIGVSLINNPQLSEVIEKLNRLSEESRTNNSSFSIIKNFVEEKYSFNEKRSDENIKGDIVIKDCFIWYIQNILLDLVSSEVDFELWKKSLEFFSFEGWVNDVQGIFDSNRGIIVENFKKLSELSSGQATILLYITKLVKSINKGSLIIFDEPETFMHPPMMKAFIRAVSHITDAKNAFCLVATHSPVIIQEIPHCNVYKLNTDYQVSEIGYKTYGQNLDSLYKNVYGIEFEKTGFNELLLDRSKKVNDGESKTLLYERDIQYLGDEAYLKYIFIKDRIEECFENGGSNETS